MLYSVISVLIIIVCIILILVVLVQNSKGGGLAANFSSSNQIMGVRKTADFLEKSTWTLSLALLAFCLLASWFIPRDQKEAAHSAIRDKISTEVDLNQNNVPTQAPANGPNQQQEQKNP